MSAVGYLAASVPPRLAMAGSSVAIPLLAVPELNDVGIGGALVAVAGFLTAAALATASFLGQVPLPLVFAFLTVAGALSPFHMGGLAVAAVTLSIERIGTPGEGALLVTAFAVGSLLGALYETIRPTRARPHTVMMLGFLATGLLTIGAALDFGTAWTVAAIGLSGVFTASTSAAMLFLRNHLSPPHLRSQIFTVGAGFRATVSAAGAGLAASATGLVTAWPRQESALSGSAALMAGYPAGASAGSSSS